MRFEFATATRIVFGPGTLKEAGTLAREFGKRVLVVTGRKTQRAVGLVQLLEGQGLSVATYGVLGEPTTEDITAGVNQARAAGCEFVIGFGGGSAMDAAKAIAAVLTNPGELLDYLEVVGKALPLRVPAAPCLAIPTTAGTGAEVTRNAVLASAAHRVKVSLRSLHMLPRVALVDPELTYALPPAVTASTGMDALTQLLEPFVSPRANPFTDAFAREGLQRVARSLRRAFTQGTNAAAREDMSLASLLGGLCLANAGLGAVHGFAGPIGGMFPAAHGAVCAALLAPVMEVNLRALRQRTPTSPALARYDEAARLLTGNERATAADAITWVRELTAALAIPSLGTYGIASSDIHTLVEKAAAASSMKANPIVLTPDELTEILHRGMAR